MSNALIQGNFVGKAVKVDLNKNKKNQPELKIEFEIVEGVNVGRRLPYSGLYTDKAIKYTRRAMIELGWDGKPLPTDPKEAQAHLARQILGAAKAVPIEVTIASWTNPETGEPREWSTVRNVGAYQAPIVPPDRSDIVDMNKWLEDAGKGDDAIPF
jgi:hypothetical protein